MVRLQKLALMSAAFLASSGIMILTGCGLGGVVSGEGDKLADPITITGAHIRGKVHGGAFPIQGANIELWQTGVGSWSASADSYVPSSTASNPNYIAGTTSAVAGDSSGLAPGYFDFGTQTLTCTPGNYLYLTQTGGGSVAGTTNGSVVQVAVIGACPSSQTPTAFLNQVNVYMSELSTVAAAYTLGNFISIDTDPNTNLQRVSITASANNTGTAGCTGLGAAMTCTGAGLAHGFANAINLVDSVRTNGTFPAGTANATLPPSNTAIAPQAMMGTLANILQSCVDSGPSSTATPSATCKKLFNAAPVNLAKAVPTNSLQTAINIARSPGTGVAALYNLQTPNTFFSPYLTQQPPAFTVSIFYPGTAIGDSTFSNPVDVALDAQDNVYVAYTNSNTTAGAVAEMGPNGNQVFAGAQPPVAQGTLVTMGTLAVDPNGYVWVSDTDANTLNSPGITAGNVVGFATSVNATGAGIGGYYKTYTVPYGSASGIAFNSRNDLFVVRSSTDAKVDDYYYKAGSYTYTQAGTATKTKFMRAQVDSYGTFYGVGATIFLSLAPVPTTNTTTGAACNPPNPYAESLVTLDAGAANALAIDNRTGSYNAFVSIKGELTTANVTIASGQPAQCWTATTSVGNYVGNMTTTSNDSNAAAMDGSGNLFWNTNAGKLFIYANAEGNENTSNTTPKTLGGSVTNFMPCFLASQATTCQSTTALAGMAIDSSGAMWSAAPSAGNASYLMQTFGLGRPTWPLLAYAKSGITF